MKPARSKSCLVALQIWSKVAKSVLRTAKEAAKKEKEEESAFQVISNGPGTSSSSTPMFLEVGVESNNTFDDDHSFASISTLGNNMTLDVDDSVSLMEGEYEIH